MQRLVRTTACVGILPWALATAIYMSLFAIADGAEGVRIASRDTFALPLVLLPVIAVLATTGLNWVVRMLDLEPATRAILRAVIMCGVMLVVLLLLGLATPVADAAWTYVGWGVLSLYLPLVSIASGVCAYHYERALQRA